jgi:four helix bundle protein
MSEIKNYKDLEVWKRSRRLVATVYGVTRTFPKEELYSLTSQLRRAVVSIPSNIAEGHSRSGTRDFIQFISIAIGSLAEVETQLLLSEDLEYTDSKDNASVLSEIEILQKMLHSLRASLKSKL